MAAKNQHRNLTGDALHNPKGFDGASNGTKLIKDGSGALDWTVDTQLAKALDYVSAQSVPPTEVTGDVYLIDTTGTAYDINTIAWQSGNTIRIAFNGSPDLSAVAIDDYFITSGNANSSNDGTFIITTVNDGSDYIEITNNDRSDATDDEATDAAGTGYYTLAEWDAVSKASHVTFDGSIWSSITPSEGQSCYDLTLGAIRVFNGTDWSSSLAAGGVTGSGTTNYLARWTPSGSALGNSVVQDDGTQVHVGGTPTSSTMLKVTPVDKYGIYVDSDQNTTSVISAYIADIANTGTGNIEAIYSTSAGSNNASANVSLFHSNGVTAGTQANSYGLYLTAHTAGTAKWGIYQAGANDKNYFAGAMQFDTAAAAVGYVWTATDADGNGDWAAAAGGGGGDVSKVGTPVDNQIGVWTGDGTIEGDANLTYNGDTLSVGDAPTYTAGFVVANGLFNLGANTIKFTQRGLVSGNTNTIGATNYVRNFTVSGFDNQLDNGDNNSIFGASNIIKDGDYNFNAGFSSNIYGDKNIALGDDHDLGSSGDNAIKTVAIGHDIQLNGTNRIVIGNDIQALDSWGHPDESILFGIRSTIASIGMVRDPSAGGGAPTNFVMGGRYAPTTNGAVQAGMGSGVMWFNKGNISNMAEPTVNIADSFALYTKDRVAGKTGMVVHTEDGTKHLFADRVGINNVAPSASLEVKGSGTGSGTSSLKTTDSGGTTTFEVNDEGSVIFRSYTVATLPTVVAGGQIYVSDETGGATMAFSDGTNWRRMSDRAIVA